jgi:hypothetical protein
MAPAHVPVEIPGLYVKSVYVGRQFAENARDLFNGILAEIRRDQAHWFPSSPPLTVGPGGSVLVRFSRCRRSMSDLIFFFKRRLAMGGGASKEPWKEWPVLPAEEIVGEVESAEQVKRRAGDADGGDGVMVHALSSQLY